MFVRVVLIFRICTFFFLSVLQTKLLVAKETNEDYIVGVGAISVFASVNDSKFEILVASVLKLSLLVDVRVAEILVVL